MYAERRRPHTAVMPPGGATPEGALGYVSAALEVVEQAVAGVAPLPRRVMVGAGSTCTSAGLLAGFRIAARLGLVEDRLVPDIIAVRVTPWPVTAAYRITALAARTTALVAALAGEARLEASRNELATRLRVTGRYLGRGYGHVTPAGVRAAAVFADAGGPPLDTCYSGKVGACLLEGLGTKPSGPTLFWATKSSRPLPAATDLAGADVVPRPFARWLARPMPALPAAGNARISAS
jgi:D-cysteine desulfhydrase